MRTTLYGVYRYGANAANQSMCERAALGWYCGVGRTAAERREDAKRRALRDHSVYANQYLECKTINQLSFEECEDLDRAEQEREQEQEAF